MWIPDPASQTLEELMEAEDVEEEDRDELRRFAEFLRREKDKPLPDEIKNWLLGKA